MTARQTSLRLNVIANYAGTLWRIAAVYVFVPFYISFLGIPAYGLIAFYAIAMAILFIAEAGLSAAFSRESARESNRSRLRTLLVSAETVLFTLLGFAGLAMSLSAPAIATGWLNSSGAISPEIVTQCIRLMPLGLVPQIAISLYHGGLMGQQRQVLANGLNAALTAFRAGVVLLPLYLWPDPRTFFIWQAVASWGFLLIFRSVLMRTLQDSSAEPSRFSWSALRPILGYASGMFALSIISGLNTQLDRLIVSRFQPIEDFAFYALAATLSQVPALLAVPIAAALLPRFTQLIASGDRESLLRLYELNTYLIAAASGCVGALITFFSHEIFSLWLQGRLVPDALTWVAAVLAIGSVFMAMQVMVLQLALANGHTFINVANGVLALCVSIPLLIVLTRQFGLLGAAVPWFLVNALGFIILGIILNRKFYQRSLVCWFLRLCLMPVGFFFLFMALARLITITIGTATVLSLLIAIPAAALAAFIVYLLRPSGAPATT